MFSCKPIVMINLKIRDTIGKIWTLSFAVNPSSIQLWVDKWIDISLSIQHNFSTVAGSFAFNQYKELRETQWSIV